MILLCFYSELKTALSEQSMYIHVYTFLYICVEAREKENAGIRQKVREIHAYWGVRTCTKKRKKTIGVSVIKKDASCVKKVKT